MAKPWATSHIGEVAKGIGIDKRISGDVKSKLVVLYVGFWHDTKKNTYDKKEFNTNNDITATNFLLDSKGLDFRIMSATTSQYLVFE